MKKQQPFLKRKSTLVTTAAVLLVLTSALLFLKFREKPVEVTVEKVFRKEVVHVVTATGKIEPEVVVNIAPDVSGEIIELPVHDGQSVRKGDLLFKIQPDIYISQVQQSLAQLNASRAQNLEAKSRMLKAEDDFRKASLLYREKLISQSDYLASKTNADAARATHDASRHNIGQQKSLLDQNQDKLNKTVLRAPIDGSVIVLNNKLGERVVGVGMFSGTDVMRIANLDSMQVLVEVNENDIVNVRAGNQVSVKVDAYGDRVFRGIVREISNSAISKAAGTQEEVTNFSVKIRIFNHERLLKPGMSATADIESRRVPNALVVPIQSVTMRNPAARPEKTKGEKPGVTFVTVNREENRQGVFVTEEGRARFRPVMTGTTDNTHIIVTSGLKEGELVVSGSYSAITTGLKDGSRITIRK
ncbi:MAG: efflux RND transporter periplasmic adaptor subunit [Chlorobiaceae bacterium]|nr:efflux RND transporter periplasmic adaptor subunit [Chlorobiaceae bacterium]NTV61019.1 efflux RND transporter periplasmic adaptor subunit [Chlorobiaceae bacterium]